MRKGEMCGREVRQAVLLRWDEGLGPSLSTLSVCGNGPIFFITAANLRIWRAKRTFPQAHTWTEPHKENEKMSPGIAQI
jgi:hypothetical protein